MKCEWHLCMTETNGKRFCSKKCNSKYSVDKRRKKLKLLAIDYKGGSCALCGYKKCVYSMCFHHLDPKTKDFHLSKNGHTKSWLKIKEELDKCILLCHNCHGEIHAGISSVSYNNMKPFVYTELLLKEEKKVKIADSEGGTVKIVTKKIAEQTPCLICKTMKNKNLSYCSPECSSKSTWRINWDEVDLYDLIFIQNLPFTTIGKMLGVSDNAVRKRMQTLKLSRLDSNQQCNEATH